LAAAIKKALGVDAEVAPGARGAFEVMKDGALVFSKLRDGRFPRDEQEVLSALGA
jgi:selT/selW/selH-like putative selenoprotein